jgi:hypothetical protein
MTAADKTFMVEAMTASSCAGGHTVGLWGHLSRMTGGKSGGSTSSIVSVSALVIWPEANVVIGDDLLKAGLRPV